MSKQTKMIEGNENDWRESMNDENNYVITLQTKKKQHILGQGIYRTWGMDWLNGMVPTSEVYDIEEGEKKWK